MTIEELETVEALKKVTSALKDIINAAGNREPYTEQELEDIFTDACSEGEDVLKRRHNIEV